MPFRNGSTSEEKSVVHNYVVQVVPKTVDVKIDYVLRNPDGSETVRDSVIKTVELGSEVGVTEQKSFPGYNLTGVSEGATFNSDQFVFAKQVVDFNAIRANKAVDAGTGDTTPPAVPVFKVYYDLDAIAAANIAEAIEKTRLAAENLTAETVGAARTAVDLIKGYPQAAGLNTVLAAADAVVTVKGDGSETNIIAAREAINAITTEENAANKVQLEANLWKEENKAILQKTVEQVRADDKEAIIDALINHHLSQDAKLLLNEVKLLLEAMLTKLGGQEVLNLKKAQDAVAVASADSTAEKSQQLKRR